MNFKKKLAVATSAVLCCSVMTFFGTTATADTVADAALSQASYTLSLPELAAETAPLTEEQKAVFNEMKSLTKIPYSSTIAKKIKSYEGKTSKTKRSYSKSYTKKLADKIAKAKSFKVGVRDTQQIVEIAGKGGNIRMIMFAQGTAMIIYLNINDSTVSICDPLTKQCVSSAFDPEQISQTIGMDVSDLTGTNSLFGEEDTEAIQKEKADVFKFKYKDETYTYERFSEAGFVFNSKGTPIMVCSDGEVMGVKLSTSVSNSTFEIPEDYAIVDLSDMQ